MHDYLLAIKEKRGKYVTPIWEYLPIYDGEDMTKLEGIDAFTIKTTAEELMQLLLPENENMITVEESNGEFVILYYDNGSLRELREGPCFKVNSRYLITNNILEFIKTNLHDKIILNRIFTSLNNIPNKSPGFADLLRALNNLDESNLNELNNIFYIDYLELRSLGMFIATKLSSVYETNVNKFEKGKPSLRKQSVPKLKKELISGEVA